MELTVQISKTGSRETITLNGFKFHRYPGSKHLTDKNYFKGPITKNKQIKND